MSTEDDELIIHLRQFTVEINGNLLSLVEVNPKSIVLKLPCCLVQECLIGIKHGKLVYDSRHRYIVSIN